MIDLNRLGAGRKLIQEVMKTAKHANTNWSKQSQTYKLNKTQKNPHTRKSRQTKR